MYKNYSGSALGEILFPVSILVLMDLCIKTNSMKIVLKRKKNVSILVLMDLCIKTIGG